MSLTKTELTEIQKELLEQFKQNVADILTPDHTDAELLKWLRLRGFNLKKTEDIFREIDSCRKTYGVNSLPKTYQKLEVFEKYECTSILGFCKEGSIIRYVGFALDFWGFLMSSTAYDVCMYAANMVECDKKKMKEENMKTGRDIDSITYIMDFEKFQIRKVLNKYILRLALEYCYTVQECFPEFACRVFIVNAPSFFDKMFNFFKPVLTESLRNAVFAAKPGQAGELLRKYIDADILPAFLGGNRLDSNGDPYCSEFIKHEKNIRIPKTYYLNNCRHKLSSTDTGVETVCIPARTAYNVPLVITKAGTRIKIEFRTENGEIHFCILYRDFGNDPENLDIPKSNEYLNPKDEKCNVKKVSLKLRVLSHFWTSSETDIAHRQGIHILQFDNTDSWFTSKMLYYRITLLDPEIQPIASSSI